jgi:hypothetical protein
MLAVAAQMPIARERSWSGKRCLIAARVDGIISAPPRPMTARIAISAPAEETKAAIVEARPKISSPIVNIRRLPKRSLSVPPVSKRPAKSSEYASTIHCNSLVEVCSSALRVGSAILTIVLSIVIISRARHRALSAHHRREYAVFAVIVHTFAELRFKTVRTVCNNTVRTVACQVLIGLDLLAIIMRKGGWFRRIGQVRVAAHCSKKVVASATRKAPRARAPYFNILGAQGAIVALIRSVWAAKRGRRA